MDLDQETQKRIQELQLIEHNLHNFILQKQNFQLELNETVNAAQEVGRTEDDIYRVSSSIMIKADKKKVLKELEEKKKVLELRIQTIEKQEKLLESKAKEIQEEAKKSLEKEK